MEPREVVENYLAALAAQDADALAELFAVDAVVEIPFGPEVGETAVFEGREAQRARFAAHAPVIRVRGAELVYLLETGDGDAVVFEYDYSATAVPTGRDFVSRFLCVMRLRDGQIAHSRDFTNPLVGAQAFAS